MLLLTGMIPPAAAVNEEPALFRLAYRLADENVTLTVEAKGGAHNSSRPGEKPDVWKLKPGDIVQGARPREIIVDLYRRANPQPLIIGRVHVRYYPAKGGGWQPFYRLEPAPELAGTLPDLRMPTRFTGTLVISGGALPIPDGYYPFVEFRFDTEKTSIDGWVVR